MRVELMEYTPHPEEVVALAAETCHTADLPEMTGMSGGKREKIIEFIKGCGHMSVLEHANFTFAISGVSRSLTHQLVRHRLASYSQQSQRYVDMKGFSYVTPPTIRDDETASKVFSVIMENLAKGYEHLETLGVPMEDARYILPNAACTNIVVTMNGRELWHFFSLRCCNRAQWEIKALANKMLREVKGVAPTIFSDAGAPCKRGPCPEGELSCKLQNDGGASKGQRGGGPTSGRKAPKGKRGRPKKRGRPSKSGRGKAR